MTSSQPSAMAIDDTLRPVLVGVPVHRSLASSAGRRPRADTAATGGVIHLRHEDPPVHDVWTTPARLAHLVHVRVKAGPSVSAVSAVRLVVVAVVRRVAVAVCPSRGGLVVMVARAITTNSTIASTNTLTARAAISIQRRPNLIRPHHIAPGIETSHHRHPSTAVISTTITVAVKVIRPLTTTMPTTITIVRPLGRPATSTATVMGHDSNDTMIIDVMHARVTREAPLQTGSDSGEGSGSEVRGR